MLRTARVPRPVDFGARILNNFSIYSLLWPVTGPGHRDRGGVASAQGSASGEEQLTIQREAGLGSLSLSLSHSWGAPYRCEREGGERSLESVGRLPGLPLASCRN